MNTHDPQSDMFRRGDFVRWSAKGLDYVNHYRRFDKYNPETEIGRVVTVGANSLLVQFPSRKTEVCYSIDYFQKSAEPEAAMPAAPAENGPAWYRSLSRLLWSLGGNKRTPI